MHADIIVGWGYLPDTGDSAYRRDATETWARTPKLKRKKIETELRLGYTENLH
jgi:hypothetical protein